MSITATLKGKLKSMFRSGENIALPSLESRDEQNYSFEKTEKFETNSHLKENDSAIFDPVIFDTFDTDEFPFDSATNIHTNQYQDISNVSLNKPTDTPFSLEETNLTNEIASNITVSKEKISQGHHLLSKAFSVSTELLTIINATIAKQYRILPVQLVDSKLTMFFSDENLRNMVEPVIVQQLASQKLNYTLEFILCDAPLLTDIIRTVYSENSNLLAIEQQRIVEQHNQIFQELDADVQIPTSISFDTNAQLNKEQSVFQLMIANWLVISYMKRGTDCDIDLDYNIKNDGTEEFDLWVRSRIDGAMQEVLRRRTTIETFKKIVNVLKVLAGLDTAKMKEHSTGYITGRLVYGTRSPKVEMRCNFIPTGKNGVYSVSIRFQSQQENNLTLKTIGLFDSDEKKISVHILHATDGIVLICGRINCGKNTTQIAIINELKLLFPDKKIILIEDPIEQRLSRVNQYEVDTNDSGNNYIRILRSCLRQNPDILGVGEIRDAESANLTLEAARSGHLTFGTIHSADTTKCIEKMISLTGDNSSLSDSLRAIISQKLVRKNCNNCIKESDKNLPEVPRLNDYIAKVGNQNKVGFMRSTGKMEGGTVCYVCQGTGLHGRTGIFEILTFSEKLRNLVLKNAPSFEIRKQAIKEGLKSLFLNGLTKALAGEISLEELIRETGYPNAEKEGLSFEYDLADEVN